MAGTNMATTSLTPVGHAADSPEPFLRFSLAMAMRPKFPTYEIRIWAMMLKISHISGLNGR